ncbi:MAG: N-methyl-L-tryptophan oxidase [bacterium]|jgi:sarcosine oxidase
MSYDVIVAGLGGMGSVAAWQLARRGHSVLGLERFTAGHDQGSSHGDSRVIRLAYFEDPAYVPLLQRAFELWREIEAESGEDLMTLTGGMMIGAEDSQTVAGALRSAQEWGLPHEMLSAEEARRRYPHFQLQEGEIAFYEENAGFVRPERSSLAHLDRARTHGAELHFEESISSWRPEGDGVVVTTDRGTYRANRLVVAGGAWSPELLADLQLPLEVQRLTLFWFQPTGSLDLWQPERMPVYIWESREFEQIYGFPAIDGPSGGAKVAYFRVGPTVTRPEDVDRDVAPQEVERMRLPLASRMPQLNGSFLRAKTCLYTNSPDEHFFLGLHPEFPQVSLAAGFSGHGFKFASVIGEVLADLATEQKTAHPIALFDPQRFAWRETPQPSSM